MTFAGVLLVAAGAAVGAPLRYLVTRRIARWNPAYLALGTLIVNITGSLILGVVVGHGSSMTVLAVGTGFCGALTTFSGFTIEVIELGAARRRTTAVATVALSLVLCVAAAALGLVIGRIVS